MSILDKIEHRIEGVVVNVFSKIGSHNIKPIDLVIALRGEMDRSSTEVKNAKHVVSNLYTLVLSSTDFDKIETWGPSEFASELVDLLTEHQLNESYSLIGEIVVSFEENPDAKPGVYDVLSEAKRYTSTPEPKDSTSISALSGMNIPENDDEASLGNAGAPPAPCIIINEVYYNLTDPITVIGRGSNADIIVKDSSISRRHFEIRLTGNSVIATDLQSTNGMFINGNKTKAAALNDGAIITIGKTIIEYNASKTPELPDALIGDSTAIRKQKRVDSVPPKNSFFNPDDIAPAVSPVSALAPTPEPATPSTPPVQPVSAPAVTPSVQSTVPPKPVTLPDPFNELNLSEPVSTVSPKQELEENNIVDDDLFS